MPYHVLQDSYEEERLAGKAFGSTKSGIAPFYSDKYAKTGIQVCDLYDEQRLRDRLERAVDVKNVLFEHLYHKPSLDVEELYQQLMELREQIVEEVQAQRDRRYADDEDAPPPFSLDIVECHFGGEGGTISDDDPIDYQNSTGLMWGAVREALRTQSIKLYPDDKQISQLSNRKYVVNSAGKIELEKKEAMKKRGLSSPDMGDALALALHDPLVSDWSID